MKKLFIISDTRASVRFNPDVGDQVWLTVGVPVHPEGVGRAWCLTHQTGKSLSLRSCFCWNRKKTNCWKNTNVYKNNIYKNNIVFFCLYQRCSGPLLVLGEKYVSFLLFYFVCTVVSIFIVLFGWFMWFMLYILVNCWCIRFNMFLFNTFIFLFVLLCRGVLSPMLEHQTGVSSSTLIGSVWE